MEASREIVANLGDESQTNEIFVSYSRVNKDFVGRVLEALKARGVDPWFDKDDIPKGADWWREIQRGIVGANAFVFIITDTSLRSMVCNWELAYAIENSKKIVPVMHIDVFRDKALLEEIQTLEYKNQDGQTILVKDNWEQLGHLNLIFLTETDDVEKGVDEILTTVRTDLDYLQEHTRLLQRAIEWDRHNREYSYLLRGSEVISATQWMNKGLTTIPKPRDLQVAYIEASQKFERKTQRRLITGIAAAAVVMFVLFIVAVLLGLNAENQRQRADSLRVLAQSNEAEAIENLRIANETQSRFLADLSEQALSEGRPQRALLLALRSFDNFNANDPASSIYTVDGYVSLSEALNSPIQQILHLENRDPVRGVVWNQDETRILSWFGDFGTGTGTVRIWDAATGNLIIEIPHEHPIRGAVWSADESRILSWSGEAVKIWDSATGEQLLNLPHETDIIGAAWNADESQVLSWGGNFNTRQGAVYLWDSLTGAELLKVTQEQVVENATWSSDETRIFTQSRANLFRNTFTQQILDPQTGERLLEVTGVRFSQLSSDGRFLALSIAGEAGDAASYVVQVFDAATAQIVTRLPHARAVEGIVWNADGTQLATWTSNRTENIFTLHLWAVQAGQNFNNLPHGRQIFSAAWNSSGTQVLSTTFDRNNNVSEVRVWQADTGREALNRAYEGLAEKAVWNSDESRIFIWLADQGEGGGLRVLNTATRRVDIELAYADEATQLIWNRDENRILASFTDGTVRMWRIDEAQGQIDLITQSGRVVGGVFNREGTRLAARALDLNTDENAFQMWEVAGEQLLFERPYEFPITSLVWSSDETRVLITASDLSENGIVEVMTAEGQFAISLPDMGAVREARWFNNNTMILTRMADNTLRAWDATTGEEIPEVPLRFDDWEIVVHQGTGSTLTWAEDESGATVITLTRPDAEPLTIRHDEDLIGAAWNGDATRFITWSGSAIGSKGSVHLWDAATGAELLRLEHDAPVGGAIWRADGAQILSWTESIHIWDAANGALVLRLPHDDDVLDARWSAGGSLVHALSDSRVWVWIANVPELLDAGAAAAVRDLTDAELAAAYLTPLEGQTSSELVALDEN